MWQTDDEDPNAIQSAVDEWLVRNDPEGASRHLTVEELSEAVSTGIPAGETVETPPPAAPAGLTPAEVKNENERAVHPAYCGAKYDELHGTTVKNIQKVVSQWPSKKRDYEIEIEKGDGHPLCANSEPLKEAKHLVATAAAEYAEIEKANKTMQVKGRHHLSIQQLEIITERCAKIWRCNKALEDYKKAIKAMVAIPYDPKQKTG